MKKKEVRPFTVYLLLDPRNHEVKYVGCTKRKLSTRLTSHIGAARTDPVAPRLMREWILNLLSLDLRPVIVVIQRCSTQTAATTAERFWIDHFRAHGHLLNVVHTGSSPSLLEYYAKGRVHHHRVG
jgi:GIY-YIG catalytic domain